LKAEVDFSDHVIKLLFDDFEDYLKNGKPFTENDLYDGII
jgi:hypothetical protein